MPKGVYFRGDASKHKNNRGDISVNFWKRVDKNGPIHTVCGQCWIWKAGKLRSGYGQFRGKRAHRISYELCVGEIPLGILVMHRCDNPCCVNPSHLFVGTPQDNMDDKMAKGRQGQSGTKTPPDGELNGRAKLTDLLVIHAREKWKSGMCVLDIIDVLNLSICRQTVWSAVTGRTWRHLS